MKILIRVMHYWPQDNTSHSIRPARPPAGTIIRPGGITIPTPAPKAPPAPINPTSPSSRGLLKPQ